MTLTATTNIKNLTGGYTKAGKMVTFTVSCVANVAFEASTDLFEGMPKSVTGSYVPIRIFNSSKAISYDGYITSNGIVRFRDNTTTLPSANNTLCIAGSYICSWLPNNNILQSACIVIMKSQAVYQNLKTGNIFFPNCHYWLI